jgi:uncharacterized protein
VLLADYLAGCIGRIGGIVNKPLILAIAMTVMFLSIGVANSDGGLSRGVIMTEQGQVTIVVEIASTPEQREQGLMYRRSLPRQQGMLFKFDGEKVRRVWMKNMQFAIDVLFLSNQGVIVTQLKNLPPCPGDPCPIYSAPQPAAYLLELNAGYSDELGLQAGSQLFIEHD